MASLTILHQTPGDALYNRGWYLWRDGDDEICAGPFETEAEAIEAARRIEETEVER